MVDDTSYSSDQTCLITIRAQQHPSAHPCILHFILSLVLVTWVMAFVIPNDSWNESTVMRSRWHLFSEITLHTSVQSTCLWKPDVALPLSSSEPTWICSAVSSRKLLLQSKWIRCPTCDFFSSLCSELHVESLRLISYHLISASSHLQACRVMSFTFIQALPCGCLKMTRVFFK